MNSVINFLEQSLQKLRETSLCKYTLYFSSMIGLYKLFNFGVYMMGLFYRHFLRKRYNLYDKYGDKDSWAVVTGGSSGMGLEHCKELAKEGFNICIVSKN